jgi:hypothetical protein
LISLNSSFGSGDSSALWFAHILYLRTLLLVAGLQFVFSTLYAQQLYSAVSQGLLFVKSRCRLLLATKTTGFIDSTW